MRHCKKVPFLAFSNISTLCPCCSHVNKKALDQFVTFTEQKEELTRRAEENARGDAKIRQLIETLDLRKDHDVQRTFRVGAWGLRARKDLAVL